MASMSITQYQGYVENPFKDKLVHHVEGTKKSRINKFATRTADVVSQDGEVLSTDSFIVGSKKTVDSGEFTKFFREALQLIGLKHRSMQLLIYIASKLGMNQLEIDLHYDLVTKEIDMSQGKFYNALADLLENDVIARHKYYKHRYFINPIFLFNGDRITIVKQFTRKGSDADKIQSSTTVNQDLNQLNNSDNQNE